MLPLEGITVLEFAQFMAGPSAGLKLADLGARVIKIERPGSGEAGRKIAIKHLFVDESSMVFHLANRNKQSYTADLKNPEDLKRVKKLIAQADIMTHNFRPGVMEKIGLDYETVHNINPRIIYGVVSGYGPVGPWATKPGQDLLIQSLSGFSWLSGNQNDGPVPSGLATSDIFTGAHLVQGLLAALVQREKTGQGACVEVSLLESTLDIQFEVLTTYLNDGEELPQRAQKGNAHAYVAAPYGVYKTTNSWLALGPIPITTLAEVLQFELPPEFQDPQSWFEKRDSIMKYLSVIFETHTTEHWLRVLENNDLPAAAIFDYQTLLNHPGYQVLKMDQLIETKDGKTLRTTRCPIRIDGKRIFSRKSAPKAGEHNASINREFGLE